MPANRIIIDVETYSEADLDAVGARNYSLHPSTRVLCVRWSGQTWEQQAHDQPMVFPLGTIFVAHNSDFDYFIWKNILFPKHGWMDPDYFQWEDLMVRCRLNNVPAKLENAGMFLNLDVQKDKEGKTLMLSMSKPAKVSKSNPDPLRNHTPENFISLASYCRQDVAAEEALDTILPPMPSCVRPMLKTHAGINNRGVLVDLKRVAKIKALAEEYCLSLDEDMERLTRGAVTAGTQHARFGKWLFEDMGVEPIIGLKTGSPTVDKDALVQYLKREDLPHVARKALQNRAERNKSSLAKLTAVQDLVSSDGRLRDAYSIFAASETGRSAAYGVQVHNLPKGILNGSQAYEEALDAVDYGDLDYLKILYGENTGDDSSRPVLMDIFASLLRTIFIAPRGSVLVMADYNAIEPRMAGWLCGDDTLTADFAGNAKPDVYEKLAAVIRSIEASKVTKKDRNGLGKPGIIGGGYGMGWKRMQEYAATFGAKVTVAEAKAIVDGYRTRYAEVPKGWRKLEQAAIRCVETKQKQEACCVLFTTVGNALRCRLPSGRELVMHNPGITEEVMTKWVHQTTNEVRWSSSNLRREGFAETDESFDTKKLEYDFWSKNQRMRDSIWGGVLLEHIDQGACADLLWHGIAAVETTQTIPCVLHTHDEGVFEVSEDKVSEVSKMICETMAITPRWCDGLPLKVEADIAPYYRK
jgi:DNA polymerase